MALCHSQMGRHMIKMAKKETFFCSMSIKMYFMQGAQWLSGRVLDSRPKGHGFEPQRDHCIVVLEQDTFILA